MGIVVFNLFFRMAICIPERHLCLRGLMGLFGMISMVGWVVLSMVIYILNHVENKIEGGCIDLWTDIFDGLLIGLGA